MKLALLAPLVIAVCSLHASQDPPGSRQAVRWRPLGHHETPLAYYRLESDGLDDLDAAYGSFPDSVLDVYRSLDRSESRFAWLRRGFSPTGLEIWVLGQDFEGAGFPDHWHFLLRDPRTDRVSPRVITLDNKWIEREGPRVRFADLDDDGRDELVLRQFHHNGTVENVDLELYFRAAEDLSLRLDLVVQTHTNDFYSRGEYGEVRKRLMLSSAGDLRVDVWRENPQFGIAPRGIGSLPLVPNSKGTFVRGEAKYQVARGTTEFERYAGFVDVDVESRARPRFGRSNWIGSSASAYRQR